MGTKGNIYLVDERPIREPLNDIEQLVHEIEICNIAEYYNTNCGTVKYYYNLYDILPTIYLKETEQEYYLTNKTALSNISRWIKIMKLKNNIRHVQLSKNN